MSTPSTSRSLNSDQISDFQDDLPGAMSRFGNSDPTADFVIQPRPGVVGASRVSCRQKPFQKLRDHVGEITETVSRDRAGRADPVLLLKPIRKETNILRPKLSSPLLMPKHLLLLLVVLLLTLTPPLAPPWIVIQ